MLIINIRNDKSEYIASFKVDNDKIVKDSTKGCYITDIYDESYNNTTHYVLDLLYDHEALSKFSNQSLLNEIASRMN